MMFPGTQAMGMSPSCNEMSNLSVYSVVGDSIVGLCVGLIAYRRVDDDGNDGDTRAQTNRWTHAMTKTTTTTWTITFAERNDYCNGKFHHRTKKKNHPELCVCRVCVCACRMSKTPQQSSASACVCVRFLSRSIGMSTTQQSSAVLVCVTPIYCSRAGR